LLTLGLTSPLTEQVFQRHSQAAPAFAHLPEQVAAVYRWSQQQTLLCFMNSQLRAGDQTESIAEPARENDSPLLPHPYQPLGRVRRAAGALFLACHFCRR
jgi:hypothetical protein